MKIRIVPVLVCIAAACLFVNFGISYDSAQKTRMVRSCTKFVTINLLDSSSFKLLNGSFTKYQASDEKIKEAIDSTNVKALKEGFIDGKYKLLEGLVHLRFSSKNALGVQINNNAVCAYKIVQYSKESESYYINSLAIGKKTIQGIDTLSYLDDGRFSDISIFDKIKSLFMSYD